MKCFERLVMAHINTIIPDTLDPHQIATPQQIHRCCNLYVRMLFIDYSSAFNTIVPFKLITKLRTLGLNTSLCNWILDFLTGQPQVVRVGKHTYATLTLNTGAPQGCVHSPLLYSLFSHYCVAVHDTNTVITKFADDKTVVGLINDDSETMSL
jgi:hypothetical protein